MRIIVEGSVLDDKKTGVARYLKNIMDIWGRKFLNNKYFVVKRNEIFNYLEENKLLNYIIIPWFQKRNLLWQQLCIPWFLKEIEADVYLAPNYILPLRLRIPMILIIHDLSFFHYRDESVLKNIVIKELVKQSYKKADIVITPTYYIKDELVRYFGQSLSNKIRVINAACDVSYFNKVSDDYVEKVKRKYGLEKGYLLNVGLLFNRRHPEKIIKVFNRIVKEYKSTLKLVMIGENRTVPRKNLNKLIEKLQLTDKVVLRDYIEEWELMALYKGCDLFIYLSDYEGFGMPILEALMAKKNVVCSDIAVFRELYFGVCKFVDNSNEESIFEKIIEALVDPIPDSNIKKCISKYNWENSAINLMNIIKEIINRKQI